MTGCFPRTAYEILRPSVKGKTIGIYKGPTTGIGDNVEMAVKLSMSGAKRSPSDALH